MTMHLGHFAGTVSIFVLSLGNPALAETLSKTVGDDIIAAQRAALAAATAGAGFGPQSPRDIDSADGANKRVFGAAPPSTSMNLCNIHFHENAEHRGGRFTRFAGNGNGEGAGTGFAYDGDLTEAELTPIAAPLGQGHYGSLQSGDTIEVHYVYSTANIAPGPTLASCLSEAIGNPQLRVEAQVMVLVNDETAADFLELAAVAEVDGLYQAVNIPDDTGTPVTYAGSTTGPGYNEKGSPFQVTWNVRPDIVKVDINTIGTWLQNNVFEEDHAHGVRNLVTNPDLLSPIN
ncbi:delta-class carbonic anhydrase [Yoonia sp. 2307UL14-13]|uniref:delta-class carbonic anhydrase n=1 Tax=Yoonia sp. 2307UL14-13 TaxID=3126506 RepID=UPI0030AABB13